MSDLFDRSRDSTAHRHGAARRVRKRLMALVATMVACGLIVPVPAQARPAAVGVTSTLELTPSEDLTVCKGEKMVIGVRVLVRTYRWYRPLEVLGVGGSYTPRVNQNILIQSSNRRAVSTSPSSGRLTTPVGSHGSSSADFLIEAEDVGTSTITFTDGGNAFTGTPYDRPRADPVTLTVTVKKCKFKIVYSNTWNVNEGFINPEMKATFTAEFTPDDSGAFEKEVSMTNSVRPTSNPSPLCTYQTSASPSRATVSGRVDRESGWLKFMVDFGQVKGHYDYVCTGPPVGIRPEAHPDGTGSLQSLDVDGVQSGFTALFDQELNAIKRFTTGEAKVVVVREFVD